MFAEIQRQSPRIDTTFLYKANAYQYVRDAGPLRLYKMAFFLHLSPLEGDRTPSVRARRRSSMGRSEKSRGEEVHLVCPLYQTKSNQYVLPLGPAIIKPAIPALKLGSPSLEDFSPVMHTFLQAAESLSNG